MYEYVCICQKNNKIRFLLDKTRYQKCLYKKSIEINNIYFNLFLLENNSVTIILLKGCLRL